MTQMLVGAGIPVAAAANASNVVVAALGAIVVLLQGLDQLLALGRRYIASANAAGKMERELTLWKARAGHYARGSDPDRQFAERTVELQAEWRALFSDLALDAVRRDERKSRA
jgi:uncharacterized protein DUF4231